MQGRLRKQDLKVVVDTECAHCSRPMKIEIDSNLNVRPAGEGCAPMIFIPRVDLVNIREKSIIDAF